tara:strand:- start:229 stop:534 length:306 start_codon:yes stop_codon:yes gene_type:complete
MTKYSKIYGVDVSKDVFDVVDDHGCYHQFSNSPVRFMAFLMLLALSNLKSIPGFETKTALFLIVITDGFSKFSSEFLFLCAFSACKHNKGCKELYERIVAK